MEDKISAIINREQPKDLYDLYYLLRAYDKNIEIDNVKEFKNSVLRKRNRWKDLQYLVMGKLPEFEEVIRVVFSKIIPKN